MPNKRLGSNKSPNKRPHPSAEKKTDLTKESISEKKSQTTPIRLPSFLMDSRTLSKNGQSSRLDLIRKQGADFYLLIQD